MVERSRFTFSLIKNNHPITGTHIQVIFYSLHGNTGTVEQKATARFNDFGKALPEGDEAGDDVELSGVWVTYPTFCHSGSWAIEVRFRVNGRMVAVSQRFTVDRASIIPPVGGQAPRSHNPTIHQMPLRKLDSGNRPDGMHTLSIAQAIAAKKPLVVLFATPAFCTSRMCGPMTDIVARLVPHYRGKVNFVHVEVYKNANPKYGLSETMKQWHLQTEPWIFIVDHSGRITAKFEGPTAPPEITAALTPLVR